MWPFAWWFAWSLGAVAAEGYTGAIRLPRWCSSYLTLFALALAGIACNRIPVQHVSLLYPGVLGRVSRLLHVVDVEPLLMLVTGISEFLVAGAAFVLLNRLVIDEQSGAFRGRLARGLGAVGVMSYSLYLTHMPTLHVLHGVMDSGVTLASTGLRLLVMVPACLAVAACFFWAVERHFLNTSPAGTGSATPRQRPDPSVEVSATASPVR
jgi:peptidoglycan/LPS O-acetylase OafA/YrhL